MKGLFNNPKPVIYAIVLFLVLFVTMRECMAADGVIEFGPTYTGEFNDGYALVYTERLAGRFDVGLALIGEQEFNGVTTSNNGNIFAQSMVSWKRLEMGVGAAAWIKTDDRLIGCVLGYTMTIRLYLTERIPLTIRHWSNAGICKPNRGQDLLTIGWQF